MWKIILHPDWNFNSMRYDSDIAIVVMQDQVDFSDMIRPICLPPQSYSAFSLIGTVVGWGKSENSRNGFHDETPSKMSIPTINATHCYTTFPQLASHSSNSLFCGGFNNEGKAPCLGDSGGGFYVKAKDSKWVTMGIVSGAIAEMTRGCDINKFSLYTNVARFTEWITQVMTNTKEFFREHSEFSCLQ